MYNIELYKNLFIKKYGTTLEATFLIRPTYPVNRHTAKCDKMIYKNIEPRELKCNCRNYKENTKKLQSNFTSMSKRFLRKALLNFELEKEIIFITLTFQENLQDLDRAFIQIAKWLRIVKKKYKEKYKDNELKYCYVWEQQKRGAIHFHLLFNKAAKIKELKTIAYWLNLNYKTSAKGQKEIIVTKGTNKYIILYFKKYFSKDNHQNFKNRRVFLFSKNCISPISESLFLDLNFNKERVKKIDTDYISDYLFKGYDFVKPYGYEVTNEKGIKEFKVIGIKAYKNIVDNDWNIYKNIEKK